MRQIRLDEMTDRRKVQYALGKKKVAGKINFGIYAVAAVYFVILLTCACILPEGTDELPVLALLTAVTIAIVLMLYRKYHKIMDMYDAIIEERVWEGSIDNLVLNEEIEFVDKNNQTLQKIFFSDEHKKYVNAGKIRVIYIARLDRWYLEKGE